MNISRIVARSTVQRGLSKAGTPWPLSRLGAVWAVPWRRRKP